MRWLTKHLELKVVSLILAVALWLYTSGQARVELRVPVLIDPATMMMPHGMTALAVRPREFTVVLSVPQERLDSIGSVIEPRLDLRRVSASQGVMSIALTSRTLGLDQDVRVLRSDPPHAMRLSIQVVTHEQATVPLPTSSQVMDLPLQLAITPELLNQWRIVPRRARIEVTVHGPEELLRQVRSDQVTAYALVSDTSTISAQRGVLTVPVRIVGPSWLSSDPLSAEVEVVRLDPSQLAPSATTASR